MALQQTLKNLCSKSGWCYAVFWKVKRRSRMVLTWEDVYYELQSPDGGGNLRLLDAGGTSGCRGSSLHETSYSQRQIGLAVAKMSYCVYFMGEGVIGRVAFTGKHQWVFADGERSLFGSVFGSAPNNQSVLEKYPSSWEVQFAAGIKTIAIIAVQQGVVQLGSTEMIPESIQWVDHVKSAFGTLQNLQGALVASQGQGRLPSGCLSTGMQKAIPNQSSVQGTVDVPATRFQTLSTYGANQSMCASVRSNLQGMSPSSEPSHPVLSTVQKAEIVQAFNVEMGSTGIGSLIQGSETVSTSSDVRPISNSQMHLVYEGVKQDFHQADIWGIHPTLATNRFQSDLLTTFHEQRGLSPQSKTMHPGSFLPLNASCEQKSHHVKDTSLDGSNPSVNMSVSEFARVPNNLGGVAAGSQSSFVGKGCEVQGFLADSVLSNVSPKIAFNGISHNPCSANPLSTSEDAEDKNIIIGGWDSMDTYLASFTQGHISNRDCSFGLGDELSQALGPCFYSHHSKDKNRLDQELPIVAADQLKSGKMCPLSDLSASELMPAWVSGVSKSEVQFSESKSESLLDAVVASASSSHFSIQIAEEDSLSCRTFSAKDGGSSAAKVPKTTSIKHIGNHSSQNCTPQSMLHMVPLDCEDSLSNQAFSAILHDPLTFSTSSTCPPLKMIRSSCTEDIQSMRSDSTQASQLKNDPAHKPARKRARPGESARPRPKDRQQIQDRVRELREIVPNGSKCSIDALLEKTIKHMLFLQNVTLHADNLKKNGELKDDVENGASWALELGGDDTGRPPILVKNLNQPRQFLVEMFCEEKGHFLEIADIIRSLGLTILKGVMESRSDKIWARFVVEANRDIRRVDIMMPLMHLLHVNNKSGSSMTVGSQTAPLRSHTGLECSSSSQSQSPSGFPQSSSLHV